MILRLAFAGLLLFVAHAPGVFPIRAGQSPLADAQREYSAGRYNRAVDSLAGAIAKSPNEAPLHFLLGQCHYQLREYPRAVSSFERSVQLVPKQSEYHDWLGKAYGRRAEESVFLSAMGWAKKAHKEFDIAVQLNPSNFEGQRDLIRFEMYAPGIVGGGDDHALKHIGDLEKIDALQGQLARGEFFNAKKRFPEADAVFARILVSNADRIGVYFEVADYYCERRNAERLRAAIAAAERIDSDDPRLKFYLGTLLAVQGKDPSEAKALLRSYLSTVPDNSDFPAHSSAREWLGKVCEAQGRFAEAAEEYRASLALDPHNRVVEEALKRVERR